jgi:TatD DNase family protein
VYKLIDTHVHLDEIENLEQTITEAKSANILAIIGVGSDYQSNQKVLKFAERYKGFVYPALGLHPWHLAESDIDRDLKFLENHIEEAVAMGEVGLDYDKRVRAVAPKELQQRVLSEILTIAKTYNKPVTIHSRYAWRDAFNLVQEAKLDKVVFHWYTGTSSVLRDIVNQGFFISATPAAEYHEEHRRAVKETPIEKLLLETDAPVVYRRGSEFEYESRPVHLLRALSAAAQLKGATEAQTARTTTDNAVEFFGLPG